jgi:hypothetical protein
MSASYSRLRLSCAGLAVLALAGLLFMVRPALALDYQADPATLAIAGLLRNTHSLFEGGQTAYKGLSTKVLIESTAAPEALVKDGALVTPWGGTIKAAAFGEGDVLARINLDQVPQNICVELGLLLYGQPMLAGLYIGNKQFAVEGKALGDLMLALSAACPEAPGEMDLLLR